MSGLTFVEWDAAERGAWRSAIAELERGVRYPLGDDTFEIHHGADYFGFFERLGELTYVAALERGRPVAVMAAVLRQLPDGAAAWYVCDLKVRPDHRRGSALRGLLSWALERGLARCDRAYAISMNPADGAPNRLARALTRLPRTGLERGAELRLYSLDAASMCRASEPLERARGSVSYLSLAGIKDIVLTSSGRPMPLLHAQFGPCATTGRGSPRAGCVHMFCAPADDPLVTELARSGLWPSAGATLLQRGLRSTNWDFVLTSDI